MSLKEAGLDRSEETILCIKEEEKKNQTTDNLQVQKLSNEVQDLRKLIEQIARANHEELKEVLQAVQQNNVV